MSNKLSEAFGDIDIYLFDQLLKGRYDNCKDIIDVGCGYGRNMVYFLKNRHNVFGVDPNPEAIETVQLMAQQLAPGLQPEHFVVAKAEEMPFSPASFDLVICSAVLHFADSTTHFEQMLQSMWRVLRPGGFLFARLASDIGIEHLVTPIGNGRYLLPDGSTRYLVSNDRLQQYTQQLNAELYEPIKTTNVSNLRAMTTWCMRKQ
jgi:tellurite methyltransferase